MHRRMLSSSAVKEFVRKNFHGIRLHDEWLSECLEYLQPSSDKDARTVASQVYEQLLLTNIQPSTSLASSDPVIDSILAGGNDFTSQTMFLQVLAVRNMGTSLYSQFLSLDDQTTYYTKRNIDLDSNTSSNNGSMATSKRCLWFLLTDGKTTYNAIETAPLLQTVPDFPAIGFKLLLTTPSTCTLVDVPKSQSNSSSLFNNIRDIDPSRPFLLLDPSCCIGLGGDIVENDDETEHDPKAQYLSEIKRLLPGLAGRKGSNAPKKRPVIKPETQSASSIVHTVPDDNDLEDFDWESVKSP